MIYIKNAVESNVVQKSKLLQMSKLNFKVFIVSVAEKVHSNNSKKATNTNKKRIFCTIKRVNMIITPIISKKASAIKFEELAAPLTYIPKARPKSQSNLTGIVSIVTIIDTVINNKVL